MRGYAQKSPAQEYKRESFELFAQMLTRIKYEVVAVLSKLEVVTTEPVADEQHQKLFHPPITELRHKHAEMTVLKSEANVASVAINEVEATTAQQQPFIRSQPKIGRNEACPCSSGQKYKHCHGKLV